MLYLIIILVCFWKGFELRNQQENVDIGESESVEEEGVKNFEDEDFDWMIQNPVESDRSIASGDL